MKEDVGIIKLMSRKGTSLHTVCVYEEMWAVETAWALQSNKTDQTYIPTLGTELGQLQISEAVGKLFALS